MDSPWLVLIGSLLVAIGVPTVGGVAASASDSDLARGGLLGLAAAVAGVAVPPLVAVVVLTSLRFEWGPLLALIGAVGLALLAVPAGRVANAKPSNELRLPALTRLHTTSGVLAVAAGALAVLGAVSPQLDMLVPVSPYPARVLLPAGAVLAVLGAGLLLPRYAAVVRPALAVGSAVVPLSAAAAIDTVLTAAQVTGARAGIGAWAGGAAIALAALAAVSAGLAGGVERDDVDLTEVTMRRAVAVPGLIAALLALGAFSFPVITAPGYLPPGVFTKFTTTSWGLVMALVAVVAAAVLAPMCRPVRSSALLCGAALVVLVRVLEMPLTAGRAPGSAPGLGLWFGVGCLVTLLLAAVVGARVDGARVDTES